MPRSFHDYSASLHQVALAINQNSVNELESEIEARIINRKQIFLCGNGGSAGNANHMENDFLYGVTKKSGAGARVSSLSSNSSVMTCLANDISYDEIYAEQLYVKAQEDDLLIVLSGSGNSPNIISVLKAAKTLKVKTAGIFGFSGGKALHMVDIPIHAKIDDMQVAEDIQCIVLHHIMQRIFNKTNKVND